jgi:hypothetical protein
MSSMSHTSDGTGFQARMRQIGVRRCAHFTAGRLLVLGLALFALFAATPARAQSASDLAGSWRSQYTISGWLGFTLDLIETGNPARPLRAVGAIGRDRLFAQECPRITPADRWATSTCQSIDKDGPIAFDILLAPANGAPGFEGVEPRTGATFRFSRAGFTYPNVVVDVTQPRADGSREAWSFPPLMVWSGRQPVGPMVGAWIGEVAGTTVEASVTRVADDRVAVEFRYFPDGAGAPPGRVLAGLGEVAVKDRPFAMTSDMRHMPGRGKNGVFSGPVRHLPGEWQIDHCHFAYLRLPMNATLELTLARTRDDLISMRTETIVMRPLERGLRDVTPIPSRFAGMSGLWSGTTGPLRVELDIQVSEEDGALAGEIRHFDEVGGTFPPDTPRGFTWADEIVDKVRPFAAAMTGAGRDGLPTVEGRVDTGPQGDLHWFTNFRLARASDGTLLLDYSVPNQPVAFPGPPIVLTPLDRDLAPVDVPVAAPPSGLAGVWSWRSGLIDGNVLLLSLEDVDGALEGRLVAQNVGGGCETFARTNGLCELARDHGPVNTRIRLQATGDARFWYAGAHGVRAFGGALPRYSDLRIRVGEGRGADELLVQMTAADAFGLIPDSTYVFTRVPDPSRVNLETGLDFEARIYEARADDAIGGGACEAWAKEDSLLRQRGDAALTAALDAILAGESLSVSGHPMDRQCKTMLDAIAALEADGAAAPLPALDPEPIPSASAEEAGGGELWRGSHFVFSGDMLRRWEQLDALALVDDAFEARVTIEGDGLVVAPPGGEESFADDANGAFRIGTTNNPLARDGRSFAESFDALFDDLKRSDMPEASARLRLPYPDGAAPGDHVGADAVLWRGRYTFAYLSSDGTRLFIGHEEAFGVFRYFLLTRVEEAPQPSPAPEPQAEAGIAGTWTRVGEPIYAVPGFDIWRPETAAAGTVDTFELRASADGHAFVVDGARSTPLADASFAASAVASLLAKPAPQTGGSPVSAWLGADPAVYMAYRGGGDRLFWGDAADATSETDIALLIAGERAVAIVGSRDYGGLIDLETLGFAPHTAIVMLFERSGGAVPATAPSAETEATPGMDLGGDPAADPTTTADATRSPVCLALDRRTAELNEGGPSTVQIVRAIYADVGLAFGGAETEAKCQRALDQLAGLALIGPHSYAPSETVDQATTVIDQSSTVNQTTVVQTVVDNLNAFVAGGGALDAPDAPDACLALEPIANGLSLSGGIELSGFLGDLFLSIGFSTLETATPIDCYRTLAVLDDLGLDPGDADNMAAVVTLIDTYVPVQTLVGRPVAAPSAETSRACLAYDAFTGALLERADTPLVQFLRGYAIDNGYGMGSDRVPDAPACSRMLRELVELGLDPALPDAGWSRAAVLLGEGPVGATPAAVVLQPTGRYDPRPETTREPIEMRPAFGWLAPSSFGLERLAHGTPVVAFFVPDDAVLGLVTAPERAYGFCNQGRLLSALDAYRTAASLNLLVRRLGGPPRLVLSGRDCGLAETAAEIAAATLGDPAYATAEEYAPADFDRRLDGLGLDEAERALAADAVAGLVAEFDFEEPGAWQAVVTTPDVVEAVTGTRPAGGGVVVLDARDGSEIARFRLEHGSERE